MIEDERTTFICNNCGDRFPVSRMKEVVYEEGRRRLRDELCPHCLSKRIAESKRVRGVVGQLKKAAIHVDRASTWDA
jgi:DNA-directed RNA polymerase subunit RPC12/RpoP